MRTATFRADSEEVYTITVDHPAQQQAFEMSKAKLLEHLRNRLGNDYLSFHVTLNDLPPESKMLPPQEFLRQTIESNPRMGDLLGKLDAELC